MSSALEEYLNQYYMDPYGLEEYKLNFLKNHYYTTINKILKCDFEDFQIGVKKNKNTILLFRNKNNLNFEIIFDHNNNKYYKIINKDFKNPQLINFEDYINEESNTLEKEKEKEKQKEKEKYKKNDYCILNCITQ